jgi:flagella basal body P-ring formation protein FlgA
MNFTDKQFSPQIRDVILVHSLPIGSGKFITKSFIHSTLVSNNYSTDVISPLFPEKVYVYRPYKKITTGLFKEGIEQYIKQQLGNKYKKMTIQIDSPDRPLNVPFGELDVSFSHNLGIKKGNNTLLVNLQQGYDFRIAFPISLEISTWDSVYVARDNLYPNHILKPADFQKEWRETTFIQDNQLLPTEIDINGGRTTRFISRGKILIREYIKFPPLILRGNKVTIVVRRGNVKISVPGIALQDGNPRENIYVKNSLTGKRILTQVRGKNLVEIKP